MKLLVIGAGGHGKVVAEVAEACGYTKVSFLDDNSLDAIDVIDNAEKHVKEYEYAFVGIGNNAARKKYIEVIKSLGYKIPKLIHPTAYISKTANVEAGTVVEPKAIVNANTVVKEGCIISIGAIVDHDVIIEEFCHINAGSIVKAGAQIEAYTKLEAGQVVLGYMSARV